MEKIKRLLASESESKYNIVFYLLQAKGFTEVQAIDIIFNLEYWRYKKEVNYSCISLRIKINNFEVAYNDSRKGERHQMSQANYERPALNHILGPNKKAYIQYRITIFDYRNNKHLGLSHATTQGAACHAFYRLFMFYRIHKIEPYLKN